jgi:uncharacterized protein (DUF1697 family)
MRYIALLRGINVGGNTMIKMSELKAAFENLGFENVVSYVNSGNLAFDTRKSAEPKLASKIEQAVENIIDKQVLVMVRERSSINEVLEHNPFEGQYETHKQMHVLFLKETVPPDKQKEILSLATDHERIAIRGREIYALLLGGMAESLLGRGLLEKKLKMPMTARNWRTVEKLAEL